MLWVQSNGTSSATDSSSTLWNLAIFTQQLLDLYGPSFHGPVTSKEINISQKDRSIDITLTVSCAKSSDMDPITAVNPTPSPSKPISPSPLSPSSSPNTSPPSPPISNGKPESLRTSLTEAIWSVLWAEKGGSMDVGMILRLSEKLSRTILNHPFPTSSAAPASEPGTGSPT